MANEQDPGVPPRAVVEVGSQPSPELFAQHVPALTGLLRMALLSGTEMTVPTVLQLVMDVACSIIPADGQLLRFVPPQASAPPMQLGLHVDPSLEADQDLLHAWVGYTGKPVLAERNLDPGVDEYLKLRHAVSALAIPLFLQHGWAGSLQLFRNAGPPFSPAEGRLGWMLSLLAENQMAAIESIQHLTRLASTDYLTGLRSRGYFERALEQEVHRSLRRSSPCALLLMDLDDFKNVNDRFGHHAGDDVLRQFAAILPHGLREVDTSARFGGDEFACVLPDTDPEGLRLVAQRVREAVEGHAFSIPGSQAQLRLRLSIGHALCPRDARTAELLLRSADASLYAAKQQRTGRRWADLRQAS
ncbi:MAG: GGDEF domain-containing protein [Terriglobales bacterium]